MPYDDHVRSLLTSRSARTGPLASFYSPAHTAADTFSMQSPHPRESPSLSNWSESPSCYSQSRISVDDSASETSATSGYYGQEVHQDSDLYMSSVLQRHYGSSTALDRTEDSSEVNTAYRDSYVHPLGDSSEDERTEGGAIASESNDTLSDTGALRPVESDTSVSSSLSTDPLPDPRLSFLGPKTRIISKAPWEENDTIQEEALSDTETQTDTLSIFTGKLKVKGRTRSKTVTSEKTGKERRFLGGGWGRSSTDTRPSVDSFKRSMDVPISPRSGSVPDQMRIAARTPSLFSTSSGASSGPSGTLPGAWPRLEAKLSSGLSVNSFSMDSRATSPAPSGSPTASSFVHPYANLELLPPGQGAGGTLPSRSNSDTTLTSVSPHMTPSSSASSSTSPGHDKTFAGLKRERRRPPQISVSPLDRSFGEIGTAIKSPSVLSTNFSLVSPTLKMSPANDDTPAGMLGFPGSPASNLISLEQAQMKARERSKSAASETVHTSPLRKELKPKKSKPTFAGIGGGFSSTIGVDSPSPAWTPEDGRARTVSAGSALHGRSKGYTATSNLAAQSTTSINIIQGGGIENIPEAGASKSSGLSGSTTHSVGSSGTASVDTTPPRTLKPKRSGFLKFFKDMTSSNSSSNSGNPNISAPSTPIHLAHTTMETLPPVPKVPVQFQSKASTLSDEGSLRDKAPPPVVVSSPDPRSLERSQSVSDDSHTSIGDHAGVHTSRDKYSRSNTDPVKLSDNAGARGEPFDGLRLRPVSSAFNGLPDDYLASSPHTSSGARSSSEAKLSGDYGFEETNVFSPVTPSFPASARSRYTHGSSASSGSDAFSSLVDPRTPSSLGGFPPGVPRTSTDSQSSAAVIALLREQLRAVRQASRIRVNELESQVQELKAELEKAGCDQCGRRVSEERKSSETGIVNRPRARTGGGSRTIFGAQQ